LVSGKVSLGAFLGSEDTEKGGKTLFSLYRFADRSRPKFDFFARAEVSDGER
jgi:hypothetical protein